MWANIPRPQGYETRPMPLHELLCYLCRIAEAHSWNPTLGTFFHRSPTEKYGMVVANDDCTVSLGKLVQGEVRLLLQEEYITPLNQLGGGRPGFQGGSVLQYLDLRKLWFARQRLNLEPASDTD